MTLPSAALPRIDVTLPSGGTIAIRSLSRAEAVKIRNLMPDIEAVEKHSIAAAAEVSRGEVDSWYMTASNADVECLVDQIAEVSGLGDAKGKAGAED
ncbi:MAG: hypothetical protein ACR2M4_02925 [Actinomycetota bacterium]